MAIITVSAVLLVGCNSQYATRQRLTKQIAEVVNEVADLLATVQDKASAAAAAPKLQELAARMSKLGEQFEALDMEDEMYLGEENETVIAERGKYIAAHVRLMQEQQRIGANQELREGLGKAWRDLSGGMYERGGPLGVGGQMDLETTRQLGQGGAFPAPVPPGK